MPAPERRIQILLDEERYRRLEREARESGRSVASLVHESIDLRFASAHARRAEAGRRLIAGFSDDDGVEPDWSESKAELARELEASCTRSTPPSWLARWSWSPRPRSAAGTPSMRRRR